MANPPLNGILASSAGAAGMARAALPSLPALSLPGGLDMPSEIGIGLLVAFVLLAYWYRRVL